MNAKDTVNLISAGLKLGIKAYENALRLSEAGHVVPNLAEFESRICQLRCVSSLPRNFPDDQGGKGGKGGQGSKLETGFHCTECGRQSRKLNDDLGSELHNSPFSVEGHA